MRLGMVELGCFRLKELLGRGSYGTVFLAEQEGFNRDAVLKIANARLVGGRHEELVRSRFAEELRAATRVNHPNVITLFTAGETSDGLPAIAMEYVPGPTLEELLEQRAGALDPVFLHDVFRQFGSAVSAFHRASVTHRDLSPTNVVVGNDVDGGLILKVLDFGVAKTGVDRGRASVVGTPRYMAPEQVMGTSGPESDIYALGAILWWALCGEEFQSEVQTLEDVTEARLMGARETDIRDVAPEIPGDLAELVGEMLSFEASQRPSAAEFCERWEDCKADLVAHMPAARATTPPVSKARQTQRSETLDCVCIESDHVGIGMLRGFLEGQRCRLQVLPLDGAFEGLTSRPDVVFLSARLPGGATTSLLHRARTDFPGATLVVMISSERERTAMIRAGADYAVRVPTDLPHLIEHLDEIRDEVRGASATTTVGASISGAVHPTPLPVADPVESFFGEAPELIADIGQSLETYDVPLARSACASLRARAEALGSSELTAAANALAAFAEIGDFTSAAGFKQQIEHEYGVLFRRLMLQR